VVAYGEHGPYTIVSCHGLNGYVLTECIAYLSELEEEAAELEPVVELEPETRPNTWRAIGLRVALAAAVLGSGASVAFGLV